jgi:hypothetical protein
MLRYIKKHQHKKRRHVARPWISQILHFGVTTTSPVEGLHQTLKSFLHNNRGDLLRVIRLLKVIQEVIFQKLMYKLADVRDRIRFTVNTNKIQYLPNHFNRIISPRAIELMQDQFFLIRDRNLNPHCTGEFTSIYGLPCAHKIEGMLQENKPCDEALVHHHWFFERPQGDAVRLPDPTRDSSPEYDEPEVLVRGQASDNNGPSTRRNLSEWERPEIQKQLPKSLRIKPSKSTITDTITRTDDERSLLDTPTTSKNPKRARGRPKGSKNKPKPDTEEIMSGILAELQAGQEQIRAQLEQTFNGQLSTLAQSQKTQPSPEKTLTPGLKRKAESDDSSPPVKRVKTLTKRTRKEVIFEEFSEDSDKSEYRRTGRQLLEEIEVVHISSDHSTEYSESSKDENEDEDEDKVNKEDGNGYRLRSGQRSPSKGCMLPSVPGSR